MTWFNDQFERFLGELSENNDREWFAKEKKRYEKDVKRPFENFVTDMITRMQAYDPDCRISAKEAIFRIHRDTRFSKDKTPYKTQMSAVIGQGGRKSTVLDGMYLEIGNNHLRVYGGVYMPDKDQLFKIRQEILYNMDAFNALLSDKGFAKRYLTIRGEQNKRLPTEFAEIQSLQPLIANKQFYYFTNLDPTLIKSDALIDAVFEAFEDGRPMGKFLIGALAD